MSAEDLPPPRPTFLASERPSQMSMDSGSDSDAPVTIHARRSRNRRSYDRQFEWNPATLYADQPSTPNSASPLNKRAPPSSFMFPFSTMQAILTLACPFLAFHGVVPSTAPKIILYKIIPHSRWFMKRR